MRIGSSVEEQFQHWLGLFAVAVLANYLVHRSNHSKNLQLGTYHFPSPMAPAFLDFRRVVGDGCSLASFFLLVCLCRSLMSVK